MTNERTEKQCNKISVHIADYDSYSTESTEYKN